MQPAIQTQAVEIQPFYLITVSVIAVQQKLMRHADIRTTMNIYGDVVTDVNVAGARQKLWRWFYR